MSGIQLMYRCNCGPEDCSHYKLLSKKERCKDCENANVKPTPEECHACDNYYPRCKFETSNQCFSSISRVNKLVLELQKITGKKVKLVDNEEAL